jgi:hypothetical protein
VQKLPLYPSETRNHEQADMPPWKKKIEIMRFFKSNEMKISVSYKDYMEAKCQYLNLKFTPKLRRKI